MIRMAIEVLLECVNQLEPRLRAQDDIEIIRCTHHLAEAVHMTRKRHFQDDCPATSDIAKALFVAEGLREAAHHCPEGQAALCARLTNGAEAIERLCVLARDSR